ncbi:MULTISPECIES: endonuclease domain-containing protein [unclassified Mesorhizobium]|uniref:endonuclease domain-containing protein n=1 Tax=unclassified Mesorhizobium TaxID=325217 RepID=UPI00112C3747|nr:MULTISPECIES: endonuclease domain-containing protein [unclassified Mesorhizobium]TPK52740.1 endonuclease domain-containing protein [Mesorhizobium sp. B2-5-2]TPL17583.1 endonuclease domain-containing protein [Mesorhizobium sp. B2-4-9]TPL21172.1 endonuclease domain-containing protein [Mesorhizobium sp. B2-4-7]TPL42787.1 endonuclease domain-containing protein [Mesorhizobium sp. B2-4-5]TPM77086.1 endonuclease domain-containing protein [Mesorhizobium sp. B2-1-6]
MALRSSDGVGEAARKTRSRRKSVTTQRARKLRQGNNQAEALLWLELKARRLGRYKFTRQFSIGPYYADFCCREKWLVVEIDDSQHADSPYDRRRDDFMRAQGYSILRLSSHDVLKHRTPVCETVLAALDGRLTENIAASDLRFVFIPHSPDSISSKTDLAS